MRALRRRRGAGGVVRPAGQAARPWLLPVGFVVALALLGCPGQWAAGAVVDSGKGEAVGASGGGAGSSSGVHSVVSGEVDPVGLIGAAAVHFTGAVAVETGGANALYSGQAGAKDSRGVDPDANEADLESGDVDFATLRAVDFFPVEPGMRWEYDGWGNEFAQYTREAVYRRGERAQTVHTSGAIVAYVYDIQPDRVVLRGLYPEIEDGSVDFLDAEGDLFRIILQEPLAEGAEWRTMSSIRARPPTGRSQKPAARKDLEAPPYVWETRRIEAVGLTLATPAGTFRNVIQVRVIPDQGVPFIEHYAPGVGLIRSEHLYDESIISALAFFQIGRSRGDGRN